LEGKGKKGKVEGGEGGWRLKIKGKSGLGLGMMFFISFFLNRFGLVRFNRFKLFKTGTEPDRVGFLIFYSVFSIGSVFSVNFFLIFSV